MNIIVKYTILRIILLENILILGINDDIISNMNILLFGKSLFTIYYICYYLLYAYVKFVSIITVENTSIYIINNYFLDITT